MLWREPDFFRQHPVARYLPVPEFTSVGSSGVFIVFWTSASVLAIVFWNMVKYVVTRASELAAIRPAERRLEATSPVGRGSVDLA